MKILIFFCICINADKLYFKPRLDEKSCPDLKSTCPNQATCCPLPSGDYGCCNSPDAVCCSDKRHCCATGMICDMKSGNCRNDSIASSNSKFVSIDSIKVNIENNIKKSKDVECPDNSTFCEEQQTCCQMATGGYGCCPLENAVCCDDHQHCCPTGTTCDLPHKTCTRGDISIPWMKKLRAKSKVEDVVCPDEVEHCLDGQTCCQLDSGDYGCCPLKNAVCCSDKIHCCPEGLTCDVEQGKCLNKLVNNEVYNPIEKISMSSSKNVIVHKKKICPGKTWMCDVDATCCHIGGDDWSCCFMPEAVCCDDGIHCCKHGQKCDAVHFRCTSTTIIEQKPWTSLKSVNDVQCDQTYFCNDGETCCPSGSTFNCCPFLNAACCDNNQCCKIWCIFNHCPFGSKPVKNSMAHKKNLCEDGLHFCEEGFQCDSTTDSCIKSREDFDYWSKTETKNMTKVDVSNLNTCPEGKFGCPDGQKCCQNKNRGQGCCPFEDGVCCESGYECCPYGTSCSLDGRCRNPDNSVSLSPTTLRRNMITIDHSSDLPPPISAVIGGSADIKCDDKSYCPEDTTCCVQINGQYGCCQYPNAVCCEDKIHCCPEGYQCDVAHQQCTQVGGFSNLSWYIYTRNKAKLLP